MIWICRFCAYYLFIILCILLFTEKIKGAILYSSANNGITETDFVGNRPLPKKTPQGWLDRPWEFNDEEQARQAALSLGYAEPLAGRFCIKDKYLPVFLKIESIDSFNERMKDEKREENRAS